MTITHNQWKELKAGSQVSIRPGFGAGQPITVTVKGTAVHKGQPIIDYDNHWAYIHQIDKVVKL